MNNGKTEFKSLVLLTDASFLADRDLYSELIKKVNPERLTRINDQICQEDKCLSLAGGILLDLLLKKKRIKASIRHDRDNKPVVISDQDADSILPDIYVSLTHCWPYAAAVISNYPCGIDIERRDLDLEAIYRRYYTECEKLYCDNNQDLITDVWCRKECFIKYDKAQDVRTIDTCTAPEGYIYHSIPLDGYSFELLVRDDDFVLETVELTELSL